MVPLASVLALLETEWRCLGPSNVTNADGAGTNELPGSPDPYKCRPSLDAGDVCVFHAGFAEGWDACAALIGGVVSGHG